jgi:excisionase family DNA binding protein
VTDAMTTEVLGFLEEHAVDSSRLYFLADEAGSRVAVPAELDSVLREVVGLLARGERVSVHGLSRPLTTQQAADLLGVSRPTLIALLDGGVIPFERIGTRRRMRIRDVMAYRERRRAEQYAALDRLYALGDDRPGDADSAAALGVTRHEVAAVRRNRKS